MLRGRRVASLVILVPTMLVLLLGGLIMSTYPKVSPYDELQHLDSSIKASQGRWYLPPGELVGQDAMREEACVGVDYPDFPLPDCDEPTFNPVAFQEWGINTAAGRPSVYYVITGYGARVLTSVTDMSFLLSARILNLLALAAGAGLLSWLCLRLSRSPVLSVSLASMVCLVPPVLSQAVIVNPDSWAVLLGAAVTALALATPRWSPLRAGIILAAALTVTVLIKPNFLVLALIPLCLALVRWHSRRDRASRGQALASLVAAAVTAIAFLATMVPTYLSDAPRSPQYLVAQIPAGQVWPLGGALDEILRGMLPMTQIPPIDAFETLDLGGIGMVTTLVLVSGSLAAVAYYRSGTRTFGLALAALAALVATPLLVYLGQFASGIFFLFPHRYSIPVLSVLAATWASRPPRRIWLFAVLGVAVALTPLYAYLRF